MGMGGGAPSYPTPPPAPIGYWYNGAGVATQAYYNLGGTPPDGLFASPQDAYNATHPAAAPPPAPAPPAPAIAASGQSPNLTPAGAIDVAAASTRANARASALSGGGGTVLGATTLNTDQSTKTLLGS